MKAEDVAVRLQEKRGYLILGFPIPGAEIPPGEVFRNFCGGPLVRHTIVTTGPATRHDWDEQIIAIMVEFGASATADNPRPLAGQRFFKARLEPLHATP